MVRNDFKVNYGSLKEGKHRFDYTLTDDFFALVDQDLIKKGKVDVLLQLEKFERHLTLDFQLNGWVSKMCDVCLSDLQYPVKSEQSLHVKITDKEIEEQPDIISVSENEYELDLVSHMFDYVALSLPMKIVCKDSLNRKECDPEVLKMLTINDAAEDNSVHPEWQKLKGILKN